MASDGFWYTVKNCFANTPAGTRESPGIQVFYAALTSGDHGIGGSSGKWEAHCCQRLGFCLSSDHDGFEQGCISHSLIAAYNDVDSAGICPRFTSDSSSDEYGYVIGTGVCSIAEQALQ